MKILNGDYSAEALENVKGFDFTILSFYEVYCRMERALFTAFDKVTTFDMRSLGQVKLLMDECRIVLVREKDLKVYPAYILALEICDWDAKLQCEDVWRKAKFELKISPFNCCLDKAGETTGVYSECDAYITNIWKKFLKNRYPNWEQGLKRYAIDSRDIKVEKAKVEYEQIRKDADKEYNEEFNYM